MHMNTTTSAVSAKSLKNKAKREPCSHTALGQRCVRRPHKGPDHTFPVAESVMLSHRPGARP